MVTATATASRTQQLEHRSPLVGITRPYSYSDVVRLRGSIQIEYTLARLGAERLWNLMHADAYIPRSAPLRAIKPLKWCKPG